LKGNANCNARFELFYLFNYLIEFRVFLNNLFDLYVIFGVEIYMLFGVEIYMLVEIYLL